MAEVEAQTSLGKILQVLSACSLRVHDWLVRCCRVCVTWSARQSDTVPFRLHLPGTCRRVEKDWQGLAGTGRDWQACTQHAWRPAWQRTGPRWLC